MPRSPARIESREKQAMIPAPMFLSQNSGINCLCAHYEGIWGSEAVAPIIFNFCTTCRRMVSFTLQLGHTPWKSLQCLLNGRLGGPQSQSGSF